MSTSTYDSIVIGGGPGGYTCAIRLGQLGQKTVCIEKEEVGGVCLNWGCVPSKALISMAHTYEKVKHGASIGLHADGLRLDVGEMQLWKDGIVKKQTGAVRSLLKSNRAELLYGNARVVAPDKVQVTKRDGQTETLLATKGIVIATGSSTIEIPGFKFDSKQIIGAREAVSLREIPRRLLVIGGGVIGLELGGVYQRFGSDLTVIEATSSLLPGVDSDCTAVVQKRLIKDGAKIQTNATAKGCERNSDGSISVFVETKNAESVTTQTYVADVVLVAVGMRPNGVGLGLEECGVKVERGFVPTDAFGRTNVPSIFAIGDVSGGPMLAHKAMKEGEVVAEVLAGLKMAKDWVGIPAAIFTEPEIATVGLTEAQAKEKGLSVVVGKFPFSALGRALAANATDGFFKVVAQEKTHEVLGIHIVGSSASDLINEGALAVEMHAFLEDIGLTIHAHPTFAEGLMEASMRALGHAIHVVNR